MESNIQKETATCLCVCDLGHLCLCSSIFNVLHVYVQVIQNWQTFTNLSAEIKNVKAISGIVVKITDIFVTKCSSIVSKKKTMSNWDIIRVEEREFIWQKITLHWSLYLNIFNCSLYWGGDMSNRWLGAFFLSAVQSIGIISTINVSESLWVCPNPFCSLQRTVMWSTPVVLTEWKNYRNSANHANDITSLCCCIILMLWCHMETCWILCCYILIWCYNFNITILTPELRRRLEVNCLQTALFYE